MNPPWHFGEIVQLDLRRMSDILKHIPEEYQILVVRELREAYPRLRIDVTHDGTLRIQNS